MGAAIDDTTIERVVDHVILPAVRHHPGCGAHEEKCNHELTKKARKTT
jgi:hypothetical protein